MHPCLKVQSPAAGPQNTLNSGVTMVVSMTNLFFKGLDSKESFTYKITTVLN